MPTPVLVIAGPTASGKSSLAIRVARHINGAVVNVDSVQVYRGLDIGSAKVSRDQQNEVEHCLIDIAEPAQPLSAGEVMRAAQREIGRLSLQQQPAILVGGTTLYLTAILHGLADAPLRDQEFRSSLAERSDHELHAELAVRDPRTAERLHAHDRVRVMRALEVLHVSGEPISTRQSRHLFQTVEYPAYIVVLTWPREDLNRRINARAELMVESGLRRETEELYSRFGHFDALSAIGYREALMVMRGTLSEEYLAPHIATATRQFAKRQMTFWRNEPAKRGWQCVPQQPVACEGEPTESGSSVVHLPVTRKGERSMAVEQLPFEELLSSVTRWLSSSPKGILVHYVDGRAVL